MTEVHTVVVAEVLEVHVAVVEVGEVDVDVVAAAGRLRPAFELAKGEPLPARAAPDAQGPVGSSDPALPGAV